MHKSMHNWNSPFFLGTSTLELVQSPQDSSITFALYPDTLCVVCVQSCQGDLDVMLCDVTATDRAQFNSASPSSLSSTSATHKDKFLRLA